MGNCASRNSVDASATKATATPTPVDNEAASSTPPEAEQRPVPTPIDSAEQSSSKTTTETITTTTTKENTQAAAASTGNKKKKKKKKKTTTLDGGDNGSAGASSNKDEHSTSQEENMVDSQFQRWLNDKGANTTTEQQLEVVWSFLDVLSSPKESSSSSPRLDQAEPVFRRAFEALAMECGPDHSKTLSSMFHVAEIWKRQDRIASAEPMLKDALQKQQKHLKPAHNPQTLATMCGLAELYEDTERLDEAEAMYTKAMKGFRKQEGRAVPKHNKGGSFRGLTQSGSLRSLMKQNQPEEGDQTHFVQHYSFLTSAGLVSCWQKQNKLEEAESLLRELVDSQRDYFGDQHRLTLHSMTSLASVLNQQPEKMEEAEAFYRLSLEGFQEELGPQHETTVRALENLSVNLKKQRKLDESLQLLEQVVEIRREQKGETDPQTLVAMDGVARLYHAKGDLDTAVSKMEGLLELQKDVLGKKHPDTWRTQKNLGVIYFTQGNKVKKAEKLVVEALRGQQQKLGHSHIDTIQSLDALAKIYLQQGDSEKAEPYAREALEGQRALHDDNAKHPDIFTAMSDLAAVLMEGGTKMDESEALLWEVYEGRTEVLGPDHDDTKNTLAALSGLYDSLLGVAVHLAQNGRIDVAKHLLQQVIAGRTRLFGESHESTVQAQQALAAIVQGESSAAD